MKNKLTDLNDHLFMALERLNDEDTKGEDLNTEIQRSRAIAGVAKNIVQNAALVLEAEKLKRDTGEVSQVFGLEKKA
tara:strand:- start:5511 stop:5741 length:231 start_codon:yes stop_codon:yes gene_type:complete